MPRKPSRLEETLAKVAALREPKPLCEALAHPHARVVMTAARVIEQHQVDGCGPALVAAFERLLADPAPAKSDPQCQAKGALLRAVLAREADGERRAYELGRTYVQAEPAWGDPVDSAAEVRAISVLGLVRTRHPSGAVFAAEALADPATPVRLGAAQALSEASAEAALPVLRYKLAVGDAEPEVFGATFAAFFEHARDDGLALAKVLLLTRGEAEQEAVLLALGESKRREAFPLLRDYAGRATHVAFVAMALLRDEAATAHLLEVIGKGPARLAEQALKAVAHFRHDSALCERVREAGGARGKAFLAEVEKALATGR